MRLKISQQLKVPLIGSKKIAKKSFFLILILSFIIIFLKLQFALLQKITVYDSNQTVIVKKGDSLYGILSSLEEKYNLSNTWWIKFKYIFEKDPIIKAGRYNIFPDTTISELIEQFEDGDVQLFKLAIIEGTVAKNNLKNLEKIIKNEKLNFDVPQIVKDIFAEEALVMPDTYFFSDQQDLIKVLDNSSKIIYTSSSNLKNTNIKLKDLHSRLSWGLLFKINSENDCVKKKILEKIILEKEYNISTNICDYLLNKKERDLHSLISTIHKLGLYSFSTNKKVSLKDVNDILHL